MKIKPFLTIKTFRECSEGALIRVPFEDGPKYCIVGKGGLALVLDTAGGPEIRHVVHPNTMEIDPRFAEGLLYYPDYEIVADQHVVDLGRGPLSNEYGGLWITQGETLVRGRQTADWGRFSGPRWFSLTEFTDKQQPNDPFVAVFPKWQVCLPGGDGKASTVLVEMSVSTTEPGVRRA